MAKGLRDGLGGEEITQSGAGLETQHGYFTGSVTASSLSGTTVYGYTSVESATISGTNVYAKTALIGDSVSGTNVYARTAVIGATISGTNVYGYTAVKGPSGRTLSPVGTGSPTTWGKSVQAGVSATGTGSNVWIAFGTPFASTPTIVLVDSTETADDWVFAPAGSWQAGSFYVSSKTASQDVAYVAVGA